MDMNVTTILGAITRIAQASGAAKVNRGIYNVADPTHYEDYTFFAHFDHDPLHQYTAEPEARKFDASEMLYFVRVQDVTWGLEFEMRRCNEVGRPSELTFGCYIDRDDAKRKDRNKDGISRPTINDVDFAALMCAFIHAAEFHASAPKHWLEGWEAEDDLGSLYRMWRP